MPGTSVELGFLGTVIHVEIPEAIETQQSMSTVSSTRRSETDIQVRTAMFWKSGVSLMIHSCSRQYALMTLHH